MDVLSDQTLGAFVEAIGADRPAPGAGAAAAVSLALAAACARKAFVISARHRQGDAALTRAAERAGQIGRAALDEAQRDAADFTALLRSSPGDPGPALALEADGEALLALATELCALVEHHRGAVIATMQGDVVAAVALSDAAAQVERHNLAEMSAPATTPAPPGSPAG